MAQTTGANAKSNYKIEVSTDGSTWTDISGQSNSVSVSGGDQHVGEQNTADGEAPVVTGSNKVASRTVEVSSLYTEDAGEAWTVVAARYNGAAKTIYLRYSPQGGASGEQIFTCADDADNAVAAPIVSCQIPDGDASTGDPLLFTFSVIAPKLYEESVA